MARNSVYLEGKLTKYKMNKTQGGNVVVNFTIAYYNGPQSDGAGYIQVECWNTTSKQRKKLKALDGEGRVAVHGFIKQDKWDDSDGDTQYMTKIRAESVNEAFDPPPRDDDDDDDDGGSRKKKGKGKGKKKKGKGGKKKKGSSKKKRRREEEEEDDDEEESDDEDEDEDDDDDDDDDEDFPF